MLLYTERNGLRKPTNKTYFIKKEISDILFECCEKYLENLTDTFPKKCYHDFTAKDYTEFNKTAFEDRIKIKVPNLFGGEYDELAILDYIEYLAENIKDISKYWNHIRYKNFQNIDCFPTSKIFKEFQKDINEIFSDSGLLYKLTDKKNIERIVENTPLTLEIEKLIDDISEKGTRELLKDAISLYKTPSQSSRKDSVEKIWDALERLKTYNTTMDKKHSIKEIIKCMGNNQEEFIAIFNKEFCDLTQIGNNFRIRHHETDKIDITDIKHYDYFFNRCLSLIALAIQYLDEKKD